MMNFFNKVTFNLYNSIETFKMPCEIVSNIRYVVLKKDKAINKKLDLNSFQSEMYIPVNIPIHHTGNTKFPYKKYCGINTTAGPGHKPAIPQN